MNMTNLIFRTILTLSLFSFFQSSSWAQKPTLDSTLESIKSSVRDYSEDSRLTAVPDIFELQSNPQFRSLYKSADQNFDAGLAYLQQGNLSTLEMQILILALQGNSDLGKNIELIELVEAQAEREKNIPESIWAAAIFPPYSFSTLIPDHYKDPKVREVLTKLLTNDKVPEKLKEHIKNVLSGKAAKDIASLRAAGQL